MGKEKDRSLKDLYESKYRNLKNELDEKNNNNLIRQYNRKADLFREIVNNKKENHPIFVDAVCSMVLGIYAGIKKQAQEMLDENLAVKGVTHDALSGVSNLLAQQVKEFVGRIDAKIDDFEYLFYWLSDYFTTIEFLAKMKEITLTAQEIAICIDEAKKLSESDDVYLADLKELENSPLSDIDDYTAQAEKAIADWRRLEPLLCDRYVTLEYKQAIFGEKDSKRDSKVLSCKSCESRLQYELEKLQQKIDNCKAKEIEIREGDKKKIEGGWERMEARVPVENEGYCRLRFKSDGTVEECNDVLAIPAKTATLTLASIAEIAVKNNEKQIFSLDNLKKRGLITNDAEYALVVDSGYDIEQIRLTDKDNEDLEKIIFSINAYNRLLA